MFADFFSGFLVEIALIMSIGLQNAFILRQGMLKEHVWKAAVICAFCETLLVSIGVAGAGAIISSIPMLLQIITGIGLVFLVFYAIKSFYSAIKSNEKLNIDTTPTRSKNAREVIMTALAFSLLNPHVILDTTLMGALSVKYTPHQWIFGAGVIFGAFVWFVALAALGRILAKPLNKPKTWRIINVIVGIFCLYMAFNFAMMIKTGEHGHEETQIIHLQEHK